MDEKKTELIMGYRPIPEDRCKTVSDTIIIEIVHAFKEIIIEYIDRKYQKST